MFLQFDGNGFVIAGAEKRPWEVSDGSVQLLGNLPFAVSTELLLKWIRAIPDRSGPFAFGRVPLTLLFQKEVAQVCGFFTLSSDDSLRVIEQRLYAPPGSSHYSRLSVMTQHCAHVHRV